MKKEKGKRLKEFFSILWKRVVAGALFLVPFYITYHITRALFLYIDGLSQPVVRPLLGHRVRGIGFLLTFIFLYFLGLIATNVVGRSFLKTLERIVLQTPVVKTIYAAAKQVIEAVSLPGKEHFKKVIFVESPRKGIFSIGFVTGSTQGPDGQMLLSVFIPSPPNPATGGVIFIPESDAISTNLSIEDAIKIIVSGGFLSPETIEKG